MAAVYRQFNQTLKKGFEGLNGKMNDYNAFIQANTNVVKVYVPKSVRLNRRTKQEQRPNLFGLCLARRRKREA